MRRIYQIYNQIERAILGLILIVLIVMGFVSVICRFVLRIPLAWAEEFMLFCMVWVAYLGASAAANERKHVRVGLFVGFLPKPAQKVVSLIADILWMACALFLIYLGYIVTSGYIVHKAVSLGGGYPYWIASISIPIGMILMTIRVVLAMADTLRGKNDERSIEEIIKEETNA